MINEIIFYSCCAGIGLIIGLKIGNYLRLRQEKVISEMAKEISENKDLEKDIAAEELEIEKILGGEKMVDGYCTKCKVKRVMENIEKKEIQTTKGIKHQVKGTCNICKGKISVFVKGD